MGMMDRREACELLAVPVNAADQEVRDAYQRLARRYHPDRLQHLGPEFTELAKAKMIRINLAYELLKPDRSGNVLPFVDDQDVSDDMELVLEDDDDTEDDELDLEYASEDDDIELEWTDPG